MHAFIHCCIHKLYPNRVITIIITDRGSEASVSALKRLPALAVGLYRGWERERNVKGEGGHSHSVTVTDSRAVGKGRSIHRL